MAVCWRHARAASVRDFCAGLLRASCWAPLALLTAWWEYEWAAYVRPDERYDARAWARSATLVLAASLALRCCYSRYSRYAAATAAATGRRVGETTVLGWFGWLGLGLSLLLLVPFTRSAALHAPGLALKRGSLAPFFAVASQGALLVGWWEWSWWPCGDMATRWRSAQCTLPAVVLELALVLVRAHCMQHLVVACVRTWSAAPPGVGAGPGLRNVGGESLHSVR